MYHGADMIDLHLSCLESDDVDTSLAISRKDVVRKPALSKKAKAKLEAEAKAKAEAEAAAKAEAEAAAAAAAEAEAAPAEEAPAEA